MGNKFFDTGGPFTGVVLDFMSQLTPGSGIWLDGSNTDWSDYTGTKENSIYFGGDSKWMEKTQTRKSYSSDKLFSSPIKYTD